MWRTGYRPIYTALALAGRWSGCAKRARVVQLWVSACPSALVVSSRAAEWPWLDLGECPWRWHSPRAEGGRVVDAHSGHRCASAGQRAHRPTSTAHGWLKSRHLTQICSVLVYLDVLCTFCTVDARWYYLVLGLSQVATWCFYIHVLYLIILQDRNSRNYDYCMHRASTFIPCQKSR